MKAVPVFSLKAPTCEHDACIPNCFPIVLFIYFIQKCFVEQCGVLKLRAQGKIEKSFIM